MTQELMILFFTGIALCLISYFIPKPKSIKIILTVLGVILILFPFALLMYLMAVLF
ncbi:hypothetical protein HO415_06970 [Streptococcus suis]|nr:hypothetical protein [Streptococcus suis]